MTKYCSYFLKNISCPNIDCVFLHKMANEKDCFLREKTIGGLFMVPNDEVINFLIDNYKKWKEIKKNYTNKKTFLPNIMEGIKEVENVRNKNKIKINLKIEKKSENTKKKLKKKYWNDIENNEENLQKMEDREETRSSKNDDSIKENISNEKELSFLKEKNINNNLTELDKMILFKLKNKENNILSYIIRKKFKI